MATISSIQPLDFIIFSVDHITKHQENQFTLYFHFLSSHSHYILTPLFITIFSLYFLSSVPLGFSLHFSICSFLQFFISLSITTFNPLFFLLSLFPSFFYFLTSLLFLLYFLSPLYYSIFFLHLTTLLSLSICDFFTPLV